MARYAAAGRAARPGAGCRSRAARGGCPRASAAETLDAAGAASSEVSDAREERGRAPASTPASAAADTSACDERRAATGGKRLVVRAPPSSAEELQASGSMPTSTQHGPMSVDDLRALNDSALGLPDALFCSPGMSEWLLPFRRRRGHRGRRHRRFFVQEAWAEARRRRSRRRRNPRTPQPVSRGTRLRVAFGLAAGDSTDVVGGRAAGSVATGTRRTSRQQSTPRRYRRRFLPQRGASHGGSARLPTAAVGAPPSGRPRPTSACARAGARPRAVDVADRSPGGSPLDVAGARLREYSVEAVRRRRRRRHLRRRRRRPTRPPQYFQHTTAQGLLALYSGSSSSVNGNFSSSTYGGTSAARALRRGMKVPLPRRPRCRPAF